jgi:hypothetical protein
VRHFDDWIKAFQEYASHSEAPRRFHFWAAASAVAGALRRKVWIDQYYFRWYANLYILFVAPPAIVNKSTTADMAIDLLREVPGIKFGPDAITWQALVTSFASSAESFECEGSWQVMSAITSCATELGNLLDPRDRQMVTNLITLYDGRKLFEKVTKMSGSDTIQNAWFNVVGCTTPSWIMENIPEGMIGGGLWSRIVSVYADKKEKLVAWPADNVPPRARETANLLVQDLERISLLSGPFIVTPEARQWKSAWYAKHYNGGFSLQDERFGGYASRKQTHIFKLSMIISAAQRDDLVIGVEDVMTAHDMVTDLEQDMPKVFALVGKTPDSRQADRFIEFVRRRQYVSYEEAYRFLHAFFADPNMIQGVMLGGIRAGYIDYKKGEGSTILGFVWKDEAPKASRLV